jgi:predicted ester cyclase
MENSINKEITLGLSVAIMKGQWDKVNELLDDNFTYIGDARPALNKQEYIGFMKNVLCAAMTEMDMEFMRVVEEGNQVAVDYSNTMTNSGAFMGIPATGKRVVATGQFIREIKDGKVVAEWQTTNGYGLMLQLGVIPAPSEKLI